MPTREPPRRKPQRTPPKGKRGAAASGKRPAAGAKKKAGRAPAGAATESRTAVRRRRLLKRAVIIAAVGLPLLFVLGTFVAYAFMRIPQPADIVTSQSARVVDHEGHFIGRLAGAADRVDVDLRDLPDHVRDAVLAAEDRGFYSHTGISLPGVVRAAFTNLISRKVEQGGSTITQQYVKNAFVGRERTLWRKWKEGVLALKLERQWSKNEILEAYLNAIYFGRGAYGIESAARTYFGIHAEKLELEQAALLAGIIRAPEGLDPSTYEEAATKRRNQVLSQMAKDGAIDEAEAEAAREAPVKVRPRSRPKFAAHFLEEVQRTVEAKLGAGALYRGGMTVVTTLDLAAQRAAERAAREALPDADDPEVSLTAVEPGTGEVRAMVGSRDYSVRQLNLATRGRRQAGSSFKPFVLAAALDEGISLRSRYPAPATATFQTEAGPWKVSNYDGRGRGTLDLVGATAGSVNTVYAKLVLDVGADKAAAMARRAGIRSELEAVPSIALGTSPVTSLEMADAYATFAAMGTRAEPMVVTEVRNADDEVVAQWKPKTSEEIDEAVSGNVTRALRAVVERGTGRSAAFGRPAAGKTGTTNDNADAWFAGYTPDLAAVVWVGYPDGRVPMRNVHGIKVTGSTYPARIWKATMIAAHDDIPAHDFPAAGDVGIATDAATASPSPSSPDTPSPAPSKTTSGLPVPEPSKSKDPAPEPSASPSPTEPAPSPAPSPSPTASGAATPPP